jgi:hypothetical protein
MPSANTVIKINRAPVLTLWATIVAERLGHTPETALTLGKAVAGLNAQSKARRLGLVKAKTVDDQAKPAAPRPPRPQTAEILGRTVPVTRTKDGLRATAKDEPIKPAAVQRYLEGRFGESLPAARAALEALAAAYSPEALAEQAYALYEQFRPAVPEGRGGAGPGPHKTDGQPGETIIVAVQLASEQATCKQSSPALGPFAVGAQDREDSLRLSVQQTRRAQDNSQQKRPNHSNPDLNQVLMKHPYQAQHFHRGHGAHQRQERGPAS